MTKLWNSFLERGRSVLGRRGRVLQFLTLSVPPTALGCWKWFLAAEAAS